MMVLQEHGNLEDSILQLNLDPDEQGFDPVLSRALPLTLPPSLSLFL